jgi:hypothetical protein
MSCYVDELRDYRQRHDLPPRMRREWCHLTADTEDELHAFAARLGMRREWFQDHPRPERRHYDLTRERRERAVRAGALSVPARERLKAARANP